MKSSETPQQVVPRFFLYGESPKEVTNHFLHVETIDERSRPNNWTIRPHAHANLNHILFLSAGAAEMRTESGVIQATSPAVLTVPARLIHAFSFEPETAGHIVTIADAYFSELARREPEFDQVFATPARLTLENADEEAASLSLCMHSLARELAWNAPAHLIAVEARLLDILVHIVRLTRRERAVSGMQTGRHAELIARFRQFVDDNFRMALTIADYADRLGVSVPRLRSASLKIARLSPLDIVQERLFLEAKRLLLYSNMTVSEVGYFLGFEDPAYFTRFFTRRAGQSPRQFRLRLEARSDDDRSGGAPKLGKSPILA